MLQGFPVPYWYQRYMQACSCALYFLAVKNWKSQKATVTTDMAITA